MGSHRRRSFAWVSPVALCAAGVIGAGAYRARAEESPPFPLTVSPTPPPDVEFKDAAGAPIPQPPGDPTRFFDDYSWRMFIALNWPAAADQRGVADTARKVGDVSGPRVWETWKAAVEIFQPNGAEPSPWESFQAQMPCHDVPQAVAGKAKLLAAFGKVDGVIEDFNQAGFGVATGPLIAQNRTYVRYETRVNKLEFDTIRTGKLYLAANLPTDANQPLSFPPQSVEIKAAWMEAKPAADFPPTRYYLSDAQVFDPVTGTCQKKTMALVGLHIAQKTATRPQWIWSTFEHVDTLAGAKPLLTNPSAPEGTPVNKQPPAIRVPGNPPQADPDPVQCARQTVANSPTAAIPRPDTVKANGFYHDHPAVKGTVWENYQLVMTQWPTDVNQPGTSGNPFPPKNVANITMETYKQTSSCMQCHFNAAATDFVWFLPVHAFQPAPVVAAANAAAGPSVGGESTAARLQGNPAAARLAARRAALNKALRQADQGQ